MAWRESPWVDPMSSLLLFDRPYWRQDGAAHPSAVAINLVEHSPYLVGDTGRHVVTRLWREIDPPFGVVDVADERADFVVRYERDRRAVDPERDHDAVAYSL